jgi:nitrogen fixation NifU-like protein
MDGEWAGQLHERYPPEALDHFLHPRNAGELERPDGVGEAGDPSCGDAVRITIRIEDNCIEDIRSLTYGCPGAIAVASALTELARGKTLDEAVEITDLDVDGLLGGLPEQKLHCSAMAIDALRASVRDHVLRFVREAASRNGRSDS